MPSADGFGEDDAVDFGVAEAFELVGERGDLVESALAQRVDGGRFGDAVSVDD